MNSFLETTPMNSFWGESDSPNWFSRTFSKLNPGSIRGSIFTLLASSFGSTMLSISWNMAQTGLINGVLILFISTVVGFVTLDCLAKIACSVEKGTYSEVVGAVFGDVI
jgi:amino acid permease